MTEQQEIQKQFRQQQEKFVYYLIALSVTSIGFSIYKTVGQPLKFTQIPLAVSVFSWGISIFCGFKFLKYVISTLFSNNEYLDIQQGKNKETGNNPQLINAASKGIKNAMMSNSNKANSFFNWQQYLFYLGIVSFLIWHLLEMYSITNIS
ncbi:hypothetical protein [Tenacibaculum ascidiaceicola]|uniref:hypothetical protein n=1 Tax=Tenacibaculum ascidiaceicola TaxID=1699411 RepID=UPI003CE476A4